MSSSLTDTAYNCAKRASPLQSTVGMAETFRAASPAIAAVILGLPTKSCIIDCELIAAGRHAQPDFLALLHGRHVPTCVYCFDLLELNGRDLRELVLVQRRAKLKSLWRTPSAT